MDKNEKKYQTWYITQIKTWRNSEIRVLIRNSDLSTSRDQLVDSNFYQHVLILVLLACLAFTSGNTPYESLALSLAISTCSWGANSIVATTRLGHLFYGFSGRLMFGLAFGTIFPSFVGLLLGLVGIDWIGPYPVVFCFVVLVLVAQAKFRCKALSVPQPAGEVVFRSQANEWTITLAAVMVFLLGWTPRIFISLVIVILSWYVLTKCTGLAPLYQICGIGALVALSSRLSFLIGNELYSSDWISSDVLWDEAQGIGFLKSFASDPLFDGGTLRHYFLANYWSAITSEFVLSNPLSVTGRFGIVVGVVLIVSGVLYSASRFSGTNAAGIAAILLVVAQAGFPDEQLLTEALRVPNLLPLGWLLVASYLILGQDRLTLSTGFAVLFVGVAIVLAKTPYAVILILLLMVASLLGGSERSFGTSHSPQSRIYPLGIASILCVGSGLVYLWMGGRTGPPSFVLPIGFGINLILFFSFRLLGWRAANADPKLATARNVVVSFVLVIWLVYDNNGVHHFVTGAILINAVLVASKVGQEATNYRTRIVLLIPLISGFFLAAGHWIIHIHAVRSEGFINQFYNERELFYWVGLVVVLWIGGRAIRQVRIPFILMVVSVGIGLFLGHTLQPLLESRFYGIQSGPGVAADVERLEVANYLRQFTDEESVVASNTVCRAEVLPQMSTPFSDISCQRRNEDAWLVALSGRVAFFEAPRWSSVGEVLSEEAADRYVTVTRFANTGSLLLAQKMENSGIDYFIIDQENTSKSWSACPAAIFKNSRYLILSFAKLKNARMC